MNDIFDQFDTEIDVKQLAEDVAAIQANNGKYEEPPCDVYEVKITYMGVGKSKSEKPMARVTFEIVAGDLKGRRIYMNQVILEKFQVKDPLHACSALLRKSPEGSHQSIKEYMYMG